MRKTIDGLFLVAAALLIILSAGLLLLPIGLAALYVLRQRLEEIKKGELEDAKPF